MQEAAGTPASPGEGPRREPMPRVQAEYLRQLCAEAGEPFDPDCSQAEASRRIEELQRKVGREPKCVLEEEQTDG